MIIRLRPTGRPEATVAVTFPTGRLPVPVARAPGPLILSLRLDSYIGICFLVTVTVRNGASAQCSGSRRRGGASDHRARARAAAAGLRLNLNLSLSLRLRKNQLERHCEVRSRKTASES